MIAIKAVWTTHVGSDKKSGSEKHIDPGCFDMGGHMPSL